MNLACNSPSVSPMIHPLFLLFFANGIASVIPGRDPCLMVCELFTADRRGNGFDLCNSHAQSRCSHSFCKHLYWGTDEYGERGLIYSLNGRGTPLSLREQGNALRCDQAREIVDWVPDWSFFDSALEVFIRQPHVQLMIRQNNTRPFVEALRHHTVSSPIVRDYLTSVNENPLWWGDDFTPFEAFNQLNRLPFPSRAHGTGHMMPRTTAVCSSCNVTSNPSTMPMKYFQTRFPQNIGPHVDIAEALINGTRWTENRRCRHCNNVADIHMSRQIDDTPETLILHFPRYHEGVVTFIDSEYAFPEFLNISSIYPSITRRGSMYGLMATFHRTSDGPHFYSEFMENEIWYRHNIGMNSPIEKIFVSNTAETFLYQRI